MTVGTVVVVRENSTFSPSTKSAVFARWSTIFTVALASTVIGSFSISAVYTLIDAVATLLSENPSFA